MLASCVVFIGDPDAYNGIVSQHGRRGICQTSIRGVTQDDTKYYHVVAALDTSTATRTVSLLSSPPTTDTYSAI